MNNCNEVKDLLVLHAERALEPVQEHRVEEHLAVCPGCREEASQILRLKSWLSDPELFSPAEDAAWQMLPVRLAARAGESRAGRFAFRCSLRSWALGAAAALALAFGILWTLQRPASVPQASRAGVSADGNEAFLGRIQSLYAREATARYLSECQDLLVTVVRAEQKCEGDMYDVSLEVDRARELLRKKRMLEAELRLPEVAMAKPLCDELENFLVNLSTSKKCESSDQVRGMERFIAREQLLLRINLLQSELS